MAYRDAHSGWFFAQNTSADTSSFEYGNMQKLFKFVGINGHGEWIQNNIKISVSDPTELDTLLDSNSYKSLVA